MRPRTRIPHAGLTGPSVALHTRAVETRALEIPKRDALEALVQGRSVLIPAHAVVRILEYEICALPLARRWVSGLGVHEGALVLAFSLSDAPPPRERRVITAALLNTQATCRFAIEIERINAMVSVRDLGAPTSRWTLDATTSDGRRVPWLNVDRLLSELQVNGAHD